MIQNEPLPDVEGLNPPGAPTACQWCGAKKPLVQVEVEPAIWAYRDGIRKLRKHAIFAYACGTCARRLEEHYG
jgi:hypothetical protein